MSAPCNSVKIPLVFDKEGVFEFALKEITPSGEGWTTDDSVFRVEVRVTDDEKGKLEAEIKYLDGHPEFTNTYHRSPAHVEICATKTAVGAKLPCGKFEFGLYDDKGKLVATARNEED